MPKQPAFSDMLSLLLAREEERGEQIGYRFLLEGELDGPIDALSYRQLAQKARAIGAYLQQAKASGPALLLYAPGLDFVSAFFGCVFGGVIAVPAYPPDPTRVERMLPRLRAIIQDAGAQFVLTTSFIREMAESISPELSSLHWIATDTISTSLEDSWRRPALDQEGIAFLQYTSGSTGNPKGVMVSHQNLLHNMRLAQIAGDATEEKSAVTWLPQYHDLGLVAGLLAPLYVGSPVLSFSPLDFLQRPLRWLQAISKTRATHSGGPNFAFELCVKKTSPNERQALDLSSWEVAYNGAEPIRPETLRRFSEAFAPSGFRPNAFLPCFGLAEVTVGASWARKETRPRLFTVSARALQQGRIEEATADDRATFVSCGASPSPEQEILIINPTTRRRCNPDEVGEVWLRGPSVAKGYWQRPNETQETFGARLADTEEGPFLRTGDLGFEADGELYITSRIKDLIILRGQNYYPSDLEITVEGAHPALRQGCVIAFSLEEDGQEALGIAAEIETRRKAPDTQEVLAAIQASLSQERQLQSARIILLAPGTIPKTSSGKLMRHACRALQESDALFFWQREATQTQPKETTPKALSSLEERLCQTLSTLLSQKATIDPKRPLTEYGLDSVMASELSGALEAQLGRRIDPNLLWRYPTIEALAAFLSSPEGASTTPFVLTRAPQQERYPLSLPELGLFRLMSQRPEQYAYNLFTPLELNGAIDPRALELSFQELFKRHDVMRTAFEEINGRPTRRLTAPSAWRLEVSDLSSLSSEEQEHKVVEARDQVRHHTFQLDTPPLVRARLLTLSKDKALLLLLINHLLVDAWSLGLLLKELDSLYEARKRNEEAALPEVSWRCVDYALSSMGAFRPILEKGRGAFPPYPGYELPLDLPRPERPSYIGARRSFLIDHELKTRVTQFCQERGFSLSMAMLAAFQVMLSRHAHQKLVSFNVVQANRRDPRLRSIIGYLAYGDPFHADLRQDPSYLELLSQSKRFVSEERFEAQAYNLLVQPPSMRVVFNFFDYERSTQLPAERMRLRPDLRTFSYLWDNHDLFFQLYLFPNSVLVDVLYRSEVLQSTSIEQLEALFLQALEEMLAS